MFEQQYFLLILLAALLLLGLFLTVYFFRQHQTHQKIIGIKCLQALRFFLMHVQRHRGLSASLISGNWNVERELLELKQQVSLDIHAASELAVWLSEHEDWLGITRHWATLSNSSETLAFPKNFSQHCKLTANVLALLDTVSEHYGLQSDRGDVRQQSQWYQFLRIGELVGQCRALGVRILGAPDGEEREKNKHQITKALGTVGKLLNNAIPVGRMSAEEIAALHSFVAFAKHNLIEHVGFISSGEYFNQATDTMTIVYECFDREMHFLHSRIAA